MKKISSLLWTLLIICTNIFAQNAYPFKVEIVGKGQPILLIPGLASSGKVWEESLADLSTQFECHVMTLAGFADQAPLEQPDGGYLPKVKDGLIQYIKSNKLENPIIMGHSLGGFLSMWIASEEPDLLNRIIVVDSYPFYSAMMNAGITEATAKPQAEMMKQMMLGTTEAQFASQQKQTMGMMIGDTTKIREALEWSLESDRATIAQAMYEIMTTDLRDDVGKITCPVLVLGAWAAGKNYGLTADLVHKNYSLQLKDVKDCNIQMAATARHFIMYDEPEWFLQTVKAFLHE